MARIFPQAPESKVFWFFSSEKNILKSLIDRDSQKSRSA